MVDHVLESFEYNKYTLGALSTYLKHFDTVDHSILLKKLELYGVPDRNRSWFKKYLSNRKQSIQINNEGEYRTTKNYMWCSPLFNTRATTIFTVCK